MKCCKCKIKDAHIAIIDKDGHWYEDNIYCCFCFAEDMNKVIKQAQKAKNARMN